MRGLVFLEMKIGPNENLPDKQLLMDFNSCMVCSIKRDFTSHNVYGS